MLKEKIIKNNKGGMLVMTLVFTSLFTIMAIAIVDIISSQNKLSIKKIAWQKSLAIAEAGVNYYRWHLAHQHEDYQDGSGQPGPYIHEYKDNLGNSIGYFSLNIIPPSECSNVVTIESTGWTNEEPDTKRSVKVKYGKKSLASFAFLTNSNAWFGENEALSGPLHSNGGIRMDGYNDGITTSAKETYICGSEHGCNSSNCSSYAPNCNWISGKGCVCSGVWTSGTGGDQSLWSFPVSNVDFDAITTDLKDLKNIATSTMCSATEDCYFPQLGLGYHIKFLSNGTFNVYRVKKLKNPVWGYEISGWVRESDDIDQEEFINNYNIPSNCGIIFVEDDLWLDGIINGHVTVVAAKLPDTGNNPKIIINGNLVYTAKDGTSSLGVISQSNIYVPLYAAPNDLEINAVLMAQKGHVFRKYYYKWYLPSNAWQYILRNKLSLYGVIITNTIWTWTWVNSAGSTISGYNITETIYDPNLTYNPPPGFPTTGEYKFLQWEETTEKQ